MNMADKLRMKVVDKYWMNEYRLFFVNDNFGSRNGIERNKILSSFNIVKHIHIDPSRNFLNQSYINESVITPSKMAILFDDDCVVPIEPEDTIQICFPHNETTFIELTSHYLYSTEEEDFMSHYIKTRHSKLYNLINLISSITDPRNKYVSVMYKIRFIKTSKISILYDELSFNRPHKKIINDNNFDNMSYDDDIIIAPLKTKKVKKSKYKKTKKQSIQNEGSIPDEIIDTIPPTIYEPTELTYIPKSRQDYFRRAYIKASQSKVEITDDNIYNGSVFTKRVYILWGNIHISFNMKWYFSSENMNDIIILLNDLYKKESRFRIQVNYYKNILITHPLHYDDEYGNIGNHFTGFFADNEGVEKTKTLHFYVVKNMITTITFSEYSKIEEFV